MKITLTLGQLKHLVRESATEITAVQESPTKLYTEAGVETVKIPLGLTADKEIMGLVKPDAYGKDADVSKMRSPWTILEDLRGQLSDGMWENSPAMLKYWLFMDFEDDGGELTLVTPRSPINWMNKWYYNGFLYNLDEDPQKIREWLANHLKKIVYAEVGAKEWRRDNERELQYFKDGTTVAAVYATYDILKGRPARGKSIYYDAFQA